MTVAELIAILSTLPADARVVYTDTYEQCEGWGESAKDPVLWVSNVVMDERGRVYICGDEYSPDEWDEDEEDE